jgi:predicted nucleotidyltransferase
MAARALPTLDAGDADDLREVASVVHERLDAFGARVFLFGSFARGEAWPSSDIDIAVSTPDPLPAGVLDDVREALEHSRVRRPVDLVDLRSSGPGLRAAVSREGKPW